MGEKFGVNATNGTGTLTVALVSSRGRAGFGPELRLSYDSGAGNGVFGFGWSLSSPSITRKTDKGLPRYVDAAESDVFILSGAEDLVPILDAGQRVSRPRILHGVAYEVRPYRPRTEGLFSRIERWTAVETGFSHWRSITRDNVVTLYGLDATSRIYDPSDPRKIFSYRICRTFDDKGNVAVYEYAPEDARGVDVTQVHEVNRGDAERGTQRYLKRIRYGNQPPYFPSWSEAGDPTPLPNVWRFEVVFDYGDHAPDGPVPAPDRPWAVRPDPFSQYRAGFEVRTYRRCVRVLLFHHFEAEAGVGRDCLVRSTDLRYSDQDAPADLRNPIYTLLTAVTQTGYRRSGNGYRTTSLPPLEFEYSQPRIHPDVLTLDRDSQANLPEGLDGSHYRWVDLDGEGVSGILTEQNGSWGYKRNLSPISDQPLPGGRRGVRAQFGPLEMVAALPSGIEPPAATQFLDLAGDGRLDVVAFDASVPGFSERTREASWEPFRTFASLPRLDWADPNLKFVDLTGDGRPDILVTEDGVFTVYPSLGEAGFGEAERVPTPWDEERGPHVVFADGTQTIILADMSGDGLSDLVRVRNGEVCYWPSLGYGRFGPKRLMGNPPRFASQDRFDARRVRLADIDGSGTTDLLYVGEDGVRVWFNRSGNAWADPHHLAVFPSADDLSAVQVMDLLGNGTSCLVWSSPLPGHTQAPLRYVDLMGGEKPHLVVRSRNNLGAETRVRYAPSTRFYLADRRAGRPWITRLPFPVHVVERVEIYDWIGRSRFVTRYAYHHGYFDGEEREFCGFGLVEQWDTEERRGETDFAEADATNWDAVSHVPPVLTRTWYHTGAFIDAALVSQQYRSEYWVEPSLRPEARRLDREAMSLPDSEILPARLSPDERREACRALKGSMLRSEVYAQDGTPRAAHPYTVTEQNFTVRPLQPRGPNRHGVFFVHPREALRFHYERQPDDPRLAHDITLELDRFGNVLRAVSIAYPRRAGFPDPEPTLAAGVRAMLAHDQTRLHVIATENALTLAVDDAVATPDAYRAPLAARTVAAELTRLAPARAVPGITNLFTFDEMDAHWQTLWDGLHDLPYEDVAAADIDGVAPGAPAPPRRRIIRDTRTLYRRDDLTGLLPLGQMDPGALPGESYRLALTASLIARVFGPRVVDATLLEGGYVQLPGSNDWWAPSGRVYFSPGPADLPAVELAEARAHFYGPRRVVDPFGALRRVTYDAYDLLPRSAEDALGNIMTGEHDYRVLQPRRITDPNGNRVDTAFDALGFVAGTASMGKAAENRGDSLAGFEPDLDDAALAAFWNTPVANAGTALGNATSRMVYDLFAYRRTRHLPQPDPPALCMLTRETHVSDLQAGQASRLQQGFAYFDGFGREIQRKLRAERGPVPDVGPDVEPRWVGSGWTIYNNKGKPVRTYEPFFSATHRFEFARQVGVSSVTFYDPIGRTVATLRPDNTFDKVRFDAWRQVTWDPNDTVLIAEPRADGDVRDHFRRLLGDAAGAFTSWHDRRIGGNWGATPAIRAAEQSAAQKAAAHAGTPTVVHFDALGRVSMTVLDNGAAGRYPSRVALDAGSKRLAVLDARGRRDVEYCVREPQPGGGVGYVAGYDLVGNPLYHHRMDAGERRTFSDVDGNLIREWDARGHAVRVRYDPLRRPTHRFVGRPGAAEILIERSIYGEAHPDLSRNLRGRLFRQYDGAGVAGRERYDFKGNLVATMRQVARAYGPSVDWSALANLADVAAIEAAAAPQLVATDRFVAATVYDALNRPIQIVTPHTAAMRPNVIQRRYNEANLLDGVDVWLRLANPPAGWLDAATADHHVVTDMTYNARGQRTSIALGNGCRTSYDYDPETFLLEQLTTTRPLAFPANQRVVQDLAYTYDPAANITGIRDLGDLQSVVFFRNRRVEPSAEYTYDAIYRLISASGREHLGQNGGALAAPAQVTDDDAPRVGLLHQGDGNAMATYVETYTYDPVGNLRTMAHQAVSGGWTRRYAYDAASRIDPAEPSNRLSSSSLPPDSPDGPYTATYAYDEHGNAVRMPHLPRLTWDEQDRLRSTTRQVVNGGTPETTYYRYGADGGRVRKVTDRQAPPGEVPTRRRERLYVGDLEILREYAGDGTLVTLEREILHVLADQRPIALIETRTIGADPGLPQLTRYQHGNHLESATLELDALADVISYEEYYPYGATSYQAVRRQTDTPKRYRYTGKERDEESGLHYHRARYYADWLGRWISCDPLLTQVELTPYGSVNSNPINIVDPSGMKGGWWDTTIEGIKSADQWVKDQAFKAGAYVQDQGEKFIQEAGIKNEYLKSGIRLVTTIEATMVSTVAEVGADIVMVGPHILTGLDSAGTGIGEGLGRAVYGETTEEQWLGVAQASGGIAEGALVTIGVLTLAQGAQVRSNIRPDPTLTPGQRIQANREFGKRFEAQVTRETKSILTESAEQVTVRPYTSAPTPGNPPPALGDEVILDNLERSRLTGGWRLTDAKSTPTAGLTDNQTVGYPQLEQFGGVVRGAQGGTMAPAGTVLPQNPVRIVRPADLTRTQAIRAATAVEAAKQVQDKPKQ